MTERVTVIVEAKDAMSGVLRGITQEMGAFGNIIQDLTTGSISWGNVAQQATMLVIGTVKNAVQETIKYAETIQKLSLVSGESAENTSRFVQVLDDYGVSAEDALAATRALTNNGLAPNIDTLAKLSDEYMGITDAQKRNEFIIKNLGRAGLEWVGVLKMGGAALREQAADVQASLILGEKQIQQMIELKLAQDRIDEAQQAFNLTIGRTTIPIYTDLLNRVTAMNEVEVKLRQEGLAPGTQAWYDRKDALFEAQLALIAEDDAARAAALTKETEAQLIRDLTIDYKGLIGSIQGAQSEVDRYADAEADAHAMRQEAVKDLAAGRITHEEYADQLAKSDAALKKNEEAHKQWAAQTVFSFAMARAAAEDGISEGEGEILLSVGEQMGLFDDATAEAMRGVNEAFNTLDASNAEQVVGTLNDTLKALTGQTWYIKVDAIVSEEASGLMGGRLGG